MELVNLSSAQSFATVTAHQVGISKYQKGIEKRDWNKQHDMHSYQEHTEGSKVQA
jgi:hypothetical protein